MTVITPPGFLQNAGAVHTAEILRSAFNVGTAGARTASDLRARGGVNPALGGALAVTQNGTPNLTVNVAAGQCFIPGTENTKQGIYVFTNDATVNLALTAPNASQPRIDLVVARVQDSAYSGASNTCTLEIVAGTPAASPSAPAAPANSLILAQLAVAASDTSIVTGDITDRRTFYSAAGGIIVCTSTTRPAAGTVAEGQIIYETNTDLFYFTTDSGTTWTELPSATNWPQGVIGGKRWVNNTDINASASYAAEGLTNFDSGSVTLRANRRYRFNLRWRVTTTGTDNWAWRVRDGSLGGTLCGEYIWHSDSSSFGWAVEATFEYTTTSAVTKTFYLTCSRLSGGSTLIMNGGTTSNVLYFEVEDLGPSNKMTTVV
jgi:hypothetical protein